MSRRRSVLFLTLLPMLADIESNGIIDGVAKTEPLSSSSAEADFGIPFKTAYYVSVTSDKCVTAMHTTATKKILEQAVTICIIYLSDRSAEIERKKMRYLSFERQKDSSFISTNSSCYASAPEIYIQGFSSTSPNIMFYAWYSTLPSLIGLLARTFP